MPRATVKDAMNRIDAQDLKLDAILAAIQGTKSTPSVGIDPGKTVLDRKVDAKFIARVEAKVATAKEKFAATGIPQLIIYHVKRSGYSIWQAGSERKVSPKDCLLMTINAEGITKHINLGNIKAA
jgi:hypothetical protein